MCVIDRCFPIYPFVWHLKDKTESRRHHVDDTCEKVIKSGIKLSEVYSSPEER